MTATLLGTIPAPDAPGRETWLQHLAAEIRPWFAEAGAELPPAVRIGVGFTSKGARSNRIGECWYGSSTGDGVPEIIIAATLSNAEDVAHVLVHELVHASLPAGAKHGPKFKRVATALGLTGRMTATVPGPDLTHRLSTLLPTLGAYPHAGITARCGGSSASPKQTTRMLKVVCPSCDYVARVARSWLDLGAPLCGICEERLVEA